MLVKREKEPTPVERQCIGRQETVIWTWFGISLKVVVQIWNLQRMMELPLSAGHAGKGIFL
jgi:hypothetical protein